MDRILEIICIHNLIHSNISTLPVAMTPIVFSQLDLFSKNQSQIPSRSLYICPWMYPVPLKLRLAKSDALSSP